MEWKEYSNYFVSNTGKIFSNHINAELQINTGRYKMADLRLKTGPLKIGVHRLVATLFLENPHDHPCVNHKDGDKHNNHVDNLEWCTYSENTIHSYATGLQTIGSEKTLALLNEEDVVVIHQRMLNGEKDHILARDYNVTSGVISSIRLNKTWKHVTREALPRSGANPKKKLSGEDIPIIRGMIAEDTSDAAIARVFGVARATINQIRQGKTWRNY